MVDELQVLLASKLDVPVQQVMISQVKVSKRSKASRVIVLHCSKVYTHYWGGGRNVNSFHATVGSEMARFAKFQNFIPQSFSSKLYVRITKLILLLLLPLSPLLLPLSPLLLPLSPLLLPLSLS